MRILWKIYNVAMEVMLDGILILCCADILKKDLKAMSLPQGISSTAFIGLTVFFITRTWKGKTQ